MQIKSIRSKLLPHQQEPFERLLSLLQSGVLGVADLSDTGTGKTYVATAVALAFGRPTLVVAPKISLPVWERAAKYFGEELSLINYEALRTGKSPYGKWANPFPERYRRKRVLVCRNCQVTFQEPPVAADCRASAGGLHCFDEKSFSHKPGAFQWNRAVGFLIFDEAHRCGGSGSLQGRILEASVAQRIPTLLLSATLGSEPDRFRHIGKVLGLHAGGGDYFRWLRRMGYRELPGIRGLHWLQNDKQKYEVMQTLRQRILSRGVRVNLKDVGLTQMRVIQPELYAVENPGEINKLWSIVTQAQQRLYARSQYDKDPDLPITRLLRARQGIEQCKVPIFVDLAQDALAQGNSVAIFVNFKQTIETLQAALEGAAVLDGDTDEAEREKLTHDFRSGVLRLLLVNSAVGGQSISLHDEAGGRPRLGLVSPGDKADQMVQVFGRLARFGAKSAAVYKVVLAAGTVEERVYLNLVAKVSRLDTLTDVDLEVQN